MKAISLLDCCPLFVSLSALLVITALLAIVHLDLCVEARALQNTAESTSQFVKDNKAEQERLEKLDEHIEEMLEHLAGVSKRGKK